MSEQARTAASAGPVPGPPLEGVVVADFSRVLAGPFATMTLADLGAEVIKIESPQGDDTRTWGPPFSATGTTYFESVNRNKRSVRLDLRNAEDRETAARLASRADVLVENFKAGTMERFGLSYERVREKNPRLVYATISGFGVAPQAAGVLGYDFVAQAVGGLMSVTGERDGDPMKVGVAVVDVLTAKDAAIGILTALYARERSGTGTRLHLNLLSSLQAGLVNQIQASLGASVTPGRLGNAHPSICPYEGLRCADEMIVVACGNNGQFERLLQVLGLEHEFTDPRFVTNERRVANRTELVKLLESVLRSRTAQEWERRLIEASVPAGRVRTVDEGVVFAEGLGLEPTIDVADASGAAVGRQIRNPISWDPPIPVRADAPPTLGADDDWLLPWLDRTDS